MKQEMYPKVHFFKEINKLLGFVEEDHPQLKGKGAVSVGLKCILIVSL